MAFTVSGKQERPIRQKQVILTGGLRLLFMVIAWSVVLFFWTTPGQATTPIILDDSLRSVPLGTRVDFLRDKDRSLTITDIARQEKGWQSSDKSVFNFGLTSSAWWFRFTVDNVLDKPQNWYFEIASTCLDTVDLYIPIGNSFQVIKSGNQYPFSQRAVADRGIVFPMTQEPGKTTYYVRVVSVYPLIFNPVMHAPDSYQKRFSKVYPFFWLFYGTFTIMIIYNLIVFFLIREKNIIYLAGFLFLCMLFHGILDGFAYQYLWPHSIWWATRAPLVLLILVVTVMAVFIRNFIEVGRLLSDKADKVWVWGAIVPGGAWSIICLLAGPSMLMCYLTSGLIFIAAVIIVGTGVLAVAKGEITRQVRFTWLSFTPVLVSAIVAGLVGAGLLPSNMVTALSVKLGGGIFVGLLSVGMADKMLALKRELLTTNANISMMLKSISQNDDTAVNNIDQLDEHREDDIGRILHVRFEWFMEKFKDLVHEVQNNADMLNASAFGLFDLSGKMAAQTNDMSHRSDSVAAAAEQMNANMTTIAGTMEQTANNVNLIASSTEQMTNTIHELTTHTETARATTAEAVTESAQVSKQADELGRAAEQIGYITEAITAISKKTNLLALNATIEAARGGDSGHGFAVVARDIKVLASQTAEATQVINQQIVENREITADAVTEIKQIIDIISRVNEIVSTIAASIEQQSSSTREIARNVSQISQGVAETNQSVAQCSTASGSVARDVVTLNNSSRQMDNNSQQLNDNAAELSRIADDLTVLIKQIRI